jgi:isoleucyl-tRNA synthetase
VAPRYGETDLNLGQKHDLPLIESVDSSGHLIYGPQSALGKFFKSADGPIIADLTHKRGVFAAETAEHTYPFCWRCDTPLMYFATNTWFVAVTKVKDQMIKTAEEISWTPAHIKGGRFGKWLEGARDWAISRNRYWGAPMPIWVNQDDPDDYIVVSSIAELQELTGQKLDLPKVEGSDELDLHRPFIDAISFQKDGKTYKRVEEVLDCWFESGSMPAAQWHYPFENKEAFEQSFPADFVTEAIDQTRLWFYVQHVVSTILFNRPAYKQVIVTGFIMAADGQKLSKRLKNYPPVEEVLSREGADALRLYLLSRVQGTETADYMRFNREAVTDIQRNVLATLMNSFKFFKTYADIDGWQPQNMTPMKPDNILDQWILARLRETSVEATKNADNFRISHAIEPIIGFVDDLSNWYIRRSRRRFWKSQNDEDKQNAYRVLHCCLMQTCQLLAPWTPFVSDWLWRQLTVGMEAAESVHLSDWPSVKKPDDASRKILEDMARARQIITEGLAQRAAAKIKVRQPLTSVTIKGRTPLRDDLQTLVAEELNVKKVNSATPDEIEVTAKEQLSPAETIILDTEVTPELKAEGTARDLVRAVQSSRKKAGFNVQDRIKLRLDSPSDDITGAITRFKDLIFAETLATAELEPQSPAEHTESVQIDGQEVTLSLSRQ